MREGEEVSLLCCSPDKTWYQVQTAAGAVAWVSAAYVVARSAEAIPTAELGAIPMPPTAAPATLAPSSTPAPAPTSTDLPAATAIPTATFTPVPVCSCSGNVYNCDDFASHAQAQACYDYCRAQGRGDIHRLDGDNDGRACE